MSNMRELVATAMAWLVRTEASECTADTRRAFQRWINEDVSHRVALTIASKSQGRIDRLSALRPVDGRVDPDLLLSRQNMPRPFHRVALAEKPLSTRRPGRLGLVSLIALGAVTICGLYTLGWYASNQLNWESYETHIGGKETGPLSDGSSVSLNTDSLLRVRMTPQAREINLVRGEAVIKTGPNDSRPLRLIVGSTVIRTAQAQFDVRKHESGQIDVTVSDGQVAAEGVQGSFFLPFNTSARTRSVISAGYTASIRPGDVQVSRLDADETARKTAWLHDVLEFRGETLAQEVEEFNRYNRRKIVIEDPKIADRRFGGVFLDTDPDGFVAALSAVTDIKATIVDREQGPEHVTIRLSRAETRR